LSAFIVVSLMYLSMNLGFVFILILIFMGTSHSKKSKLNSLFWIGLPLAGIL